jgi:hypothetical protein
MSAARDVQARFKPELELRLQVNGRLVYHLPYEHAIVHALVTWRDRPLSGASVRLRAACPGQHRKIALRTDRHGRAAFTYGASMPNVIRIFDCPVTGRASARGLVAILAKPATLRFIHPLWLETKRGSRGRIVVRVWGRAHHRFELLADGRRVAAGRIGPAGWVDLAPRGIRHGQLLWVLGRDGHRSHVIVA